MDLCERILKEGIRCEGRNGYTHRLFTNSWDFQLTITDENGDKVKRLPALTAKSVPLWMATLEMMWIYQANSIDVKWLNDRDIHIWDKFVISPDGIYRNPDTGEETFFGREWAGTIGTSYGYILRNGSETLKESQVQKAIRTIKENPSDRRIIINMWQPTFFNKAVLPPCVYEVQFLVMDGKLNACVRQRSCDTFLGVPFNITQYSMLVHLIAHCTGLEAGTLHYDMGDVHIYEEHIDAVNELLSRRNDIFPEPALWLNPEVTDFFKFDNSRELKDIKFLNYQHLSKISAEVKA